MSNPLEDMSHDFAQFADPAKS